MKKTIFVVYSMNKADIKKCKVKRYAFNTESDVKVGDVLRSKDYSTDMIVAEVLDKAYSYYNNMNGDLSDTMNSSSLRAIKVMAIREEEDDVVYAVKVEETE